VCCVLAQPLAQQPLAPPACCGRGENIGMAPPPPYSCGRCRPLLPLLLWASATLGLHGSGAAGTVSSLLPPSPSAPGGDLETILSRLYVESMPTRCATSCDSAAKLAKSMRGDGSFQGVNYKDKGRTEWAAVSHWDRLTTLSVALHCKSCEEGGKKGTGKDTLLPKIVSGVQYWQTNDFIDPNWWWNDFGVPMKVQMFLVIMANTTAASGGAALPSKLTNYSLTLLARGSDPMWEPPPQHRGGHYTGENLVWSLQLDIQRGALAGDKTLVAHAFARMWSSLVIAPQAGDGIQSDGSFHQHGPLLQSGSYGAALMTDVLNFVQLSAGTEFSIPPDPLKVLVHYLTSGQQYMLRGGLSVPNASWLLPPRGRSITRPGAPLFPSAAVSAGISSLLELSLNSSSRAALRSFQGVLLGMSPPITATRIFPDSDYAVHHRPGFSQDVRTWSARTDNAECVNQENRLGAHLVRGRAPLLRLSSAACCCCRVHVAAHQ
jgi:chondroitin AC lyase